uniref:Uncharacterized protein n=1 Tax=Arion vulgaris TaxID=1028688 RepID=A0A0B7B3V2_9EUPU
MFGLVPQSLVVFCVLSICSLFATVASQNKNVVCYYSNWSQYRPDVGKYDVSKIDPYACNYYIFAFAQLNGTAILPYEVNDDQNPWMWRQFTQLKLTNTKAKMLLAIGGYTHGTLRFSRVAANPDSRAEFARSAITHLRYWKFDGLDVDWEYPGDDSPDDKENLSLLMQALFEAFERESLSQNLPRLILAAAVPAGISRLEKGYDIPRLNRYLDLFNVMTYDFHGLWESTTNAASPLNAADGDSLNVVSAMEYYVAKGASKSKLNVGVAFYGRSWTLRDVNDNVMGSPTIGGGQAGLYTRESGVLSYYEVCRHLTNGYAEHYDSVGKVMYATSGNQFITYENENTLNIKIDYILSNGFGGAMVWALDHDDFTGNFCGKGSYPLMKVVSSRVLNAPDTPQESSSTSSSTAATTQSTSTPTTTANTIPTTARPVPTQNSGNSTTKYSCPKPDGIFSDETSCMTYYVCRRNIGYRTRCSSPEIYSPQAQKCVSPQKYTCPL